MVPSYTISPETRLVRVLYHDAPSITELAELIEAILHDHEFGRGLRFLLDRSKVAVAPTTTYIQRFVELIKSKGAELAMARVAVVVTGPACFGMARMAEQLIGLPDSAVFTSLAEAESWLTRDDTEMDEARSHCRSTSAEAVAA